MKEQFVIRKDGSKCPVQLDAVICKLKTKESVASKRIDRFSYPSIKRLQSIFDSRNISSDEELLKVIKIQQKLADQEGIMYMEIDNDPLFEQSCKTLETLQELEDFLKKD